MSVTLTLTTGVDGLYNIMVLEMLSEEWGQGTNALPMMDEPLSVIIEHTIDQLGYSFNEKHTMAKTS